MQRKPPRGGINSHNTPTRTHGAPRPRPRGPDGQYGTRAPARPLALRVACSTGRDGVRCGGEGRRRGRKQGSRRQSCGVAAERGNGKGAAGKAGGYGEAEGVRRKWVSRPAEEDGRGGGRDRMHGEGQRRQRAAVADAKRIAERDKIDKSTGSSKAETGRRRTGSKGHAYSDDTRDTGGARRPLS
ncbi:hypothetical protein BD413DRAFT_304299 [Trametes elegans]|nr:hypothetical protein BD413DRAFT_304299 [Trametes elegans]